MSYITELLKSVSENNFSIKVCIVVLTQNGLDLDTLCYETVWVRILNIKREEQIGLSAARNEMIRYIICNKLESKFVMFPDDDTTFDSDFFLRFFTVTKLNRNYLIDVYCYCTHELFKKNKIREGEILSTKDYLSAMSVNMLLCWEAYQKIGFFDEDMGVGARYGAGEDADYFIRGVNLGLTFYFTHQLWNFHPKAEDKYVGVSIEKLRRRFKNYGEGAVYLFVKHRMYRDAVWCCLRAFAGAMKNYLSMDIHMGSIYWYAFCCRTKFLLNICTKNVMNR